MHERLVVLTKHPVRVRVGDSITRNARVLGPCKSRGFAGAIFVEACKISGRPPTHVIRGRDVKPSSGNLHSRCRRRPRCTYGNIESEVTFMTSSSLFLACCQTSRGTTKHQNRRLGREIRSIYFMVLHKFLSPSCRVDEQCRLREKTGFARAAWSWIAESGQYYLFEKCRGSLENAWKILRLRKIRLHFVFCKGCCFPCHLTIRFNLFRNTDICMYIDTYNSSFLIQILLAKM